MPMMSVLALLCKPSKMNDDFSYSLCYNSKINTLLLTLPPKVIRHIVAHQANPPDCAHSSLCVAKDVLQGHGFYSALSSAK